MVDRMLTVPEEVVLLSLDDATGRPLELPAAALSLALSGAVLMELTLRGRLDSDPDRLFVADPNPCGDALLDPVLARIAMAAEPQDSRWWMGQLAPGAPALRQALLDRLVAGGLLQVETARKFWILPDRRYRKAGDAAATRERLRAVLLAGEIPEARDSLMAGLCRATGLTALLLSEDEAREAAARIAAVAALEEMSRSLIAETRDRLTTEH
ncbi:GOLPH3/VPS74 family protein [Roseomonas populi]|uniref:GPP34 family phosphoprotein n=1 Tax=Roseomonas populi TaxID=3121582 RepID=A0ABT1X2D7_9PROT|nr:GPP34 family phosphoprotein [Roseomonas pecuniae]MCR0982259.1 GPP34 family phosphoprotein [Roseomonas pecuniae]